ncbi:hypothetical protein P9990_25300 (plasmid) [Prescottella equi]|uniref:hypothetical protein n=1 Tax=Rhodococcus hoagii TaxID=43767 RepID=UPI002575A45B|nr:hypothetical protein [Prescottella equi]WJJ14513.1 hypothetical protein P9990_25300 [Prescottella equi]
MPEYRVTVEQNQGQTPAWTITFPTEGWTAGVRRFADADDAARALAAQRAEVDPNTVTIHVDELTIGGRETQADVQAAREARRRADEANAHATRLTRELVHHLRREGNLSVRDAGAVVGLAPQRISAIEQQIAREKGETT